MATRGPFSDKGGFDQVLQCLTGMAVFQGGGADKPQLVLGSVARLFHLGAPRLRRRGGAVPARAQRRGAIFEPLAAAQRADDPGRAFCLGRERGPRRSARFRRRRADRHPSDQRRAALYLGAFQPFLRRVLRADRPARSWPPTRAARRCPSAPSMPRSWCRRCAPRSRRRPRSNGRSCSASASPARRCGRSRTCSTTRRCSRKIWSPHSTIRSSAAIAR